MSGFLFSLKGKSGGARSGGDKEQRNRVGFLLGNKKNETTKKSILNQADSDSDEEKITNIDTFSGIEQSSKEEKQEVVIRPQNLRKTLPRPDKHGLFSMTNSSYRLNDNNSLAKNELSRKHEDKEELGRVINVSDGKNDEPEEADLESYKEVPVEEFGAALLKGMGWKRKPGSVNKPQKTNIDKRKQGLLLGIGAKSVQDNDLAQELFSSKAKFSIPVIKRDAKTGEPVGDQERS